LIARYETSGKSGQSEPKRDKLKDRVTAQCRFGDGDKPTVLDFRKMVAAVGALPIHKVIGMPAPMAESNAINVRPWLKFCVVQGSYAAR
jgi:hypothetical protein